MNTPRNAWAEARAEHDQVVADFLAAIDGIPAARWQQLPRPDKWSAATLAHHVCVTYAFGRDAANGARSMKLLVPRPAAWLARTFLLPRILASHKFPRGAEAPQEVRPDREIALTLTPNAAKAQLRAMAAEAMAAIERAARERPSQRIVHAYFGPLSLLQGLRVLSAHTRHHSGGMEWRRGA